MAPGDAYREQIPLLEDTFEDVMAALGRAMGGKKQFAEILRPELEGEPDRARRWLLDSLNPEHQQQLHVSHLVRALKAGRESGVHLLMAWLCRETGYAVPEPAAMPSQKTLLLAEAERLSKRQRQISEEIDRIEEGEVVREVARIRRV